MNVNIVPVDLFAYCCREITKANPQLRKRGLIIGNFYDRQQTMDTARMANELSHVTTGMG